MPKRNPNDVKRADDDTRRGAAKDRMKQHVFATMTFSQAAAWIDGNVTNLASAKTALKRLIEMIVFLRDQLD